MRKLALGLVALVAAGCGSRSADMAKVLGAQVQRCADGQLRPLGSRREAYAGVATHGAVAYRRPGGPVRASLGPKNVNNYPMMFGVIGAVVRRDCSPSWYRVELPQKPNGITGFVPARMLQVQTVKARIASIREMIGLGGKRA